MDFETRQRASALFAALGHPTRVRIVEILLQEPKSVNELAVALEIGQSGVSQHLAVLTRAGVLTVAPHGATRVYSVRGPRIGVIVSLIEEFCATHGLKGEVAGNGSTDENFAREAYESGIEIL